MKRPLEELEEEKNPNHKKLDTTPYTDRYFGKIDRLIEMMKSVLDKYQTCSSLILLERITDFVKEDVMVLVRYLRKLDKSDLYVRTLLHKVYKYLQQIGEKKVEDSSKFSENNRHICLTLSVEVRGIAALQCFNSTIDYSHLKAVMWSINMLLMEKGDWFLKYAMYARNVPLALQLMNDIGYLRYLLKCKRGYVL